MIWLIPVAIRIPLGNIWAPLVQKKLAQSRSRERIFFLQYFLCALISWCVFLIFGKGNFSYLLSKIQIVNLVCPIIWIIIGIGLLNGFACYCQWRARAISLSKSAVIEIPDDIVALVLIYLIAPQLEMLFLTKWLIIGVGLCFSAGLIFAVQKSGGEYIGSKLIGWVLGYTIIWGTAAFLMRVFAGGVQLPWHNFLLVWYNASLVSAWIIFKFSKTTMGLGPKIINTENRQVKILVILVWVCLVLFYIALKTGPLTAVKPIFLVTASFGPFLVGFIKFKEHTNLKPIEKIAYLLGLTGVITIVATFPYELLE